MFITSDCSHSNLLTRCPHVLRYPHARTLIGGALVRTFRCSNQQRWCFILAGSNAITGNNAATGIGGGLLLANIDIVATTCGGKAPASDQGSLPWSNLTSLLSCMAKAGASKDQQGALASLGLPFGNIAYHDRYSNNIATVAAKLVVACATALSGGGEGAEMGAAPCSTSQHSQETIIVVPGGVIMATVATVNWNDTILLSGPQSHIVLQVLLWSVAGSSFAQCIAHHHILA